MKDIFNTVSPFIEDNLQIIKIVFGIIIFIVLALFRKKLAKLLLNIFSKIIFRSNEEKKNALKSALIRPLSLFFLILGAFFGIYINLSSDHNGILITAFKIMTILVICWAIVNYLSDNLILHLHFSNTDDKMNTTVIKFISNILKIFVVAFAVVMVISELGYNVNGLLTGIGVGGLAVSLAAQDAISNLISGFVIIFEKPFLVGDFVQAGGIQGTVIDITMRSTKIRTIDDSIVTIPNSTIADSEIINISSMEKRLINFDLSLVYSTSNELMKKCQNDIYKFLESEEKILPLPLRVNFSKLDDSSVNFTIFCYTSIVELNEYLEYVSKINYKIKEIIEKNNAEFAYPSSSIYIEQK